MEIFTLPITIIGLSAKLILFLSGLLMMFGVFSLWKIVPPKHPLNRQAGKGLLIQFGAVLGIHMADSFANNWNGWATFLFTVLCIAVMFIGLRIFLRATKKINGIAR